jgi:hypothetical protein
MLHMQFLPVDGNDRGSISMSTVTGIHAMIYVDIADDLEEGRLCVARALYVTVSQMPRTDECTG